MSGYRLHVPADDGNIVHAELVLRQCVFSRHCQTPNLAFAIDLEKAECPAKQKEIGDEYKIPGWGLGAALFSFAAKAVIEELGPEKGEALLKKAIEEFGRERGKRIARIVKGLGKPLTLKN